jgi:thioredoxin-like negative regulator of GroEL
MGAFAQALSIDRQSQAALVGLARLHLIRGEREQARKILQQAAEFHPGDEKVRNMLTALDLPRPWDKLSRAREEPAPAVEVVETVANEPESIFTATLAEIYVKQGLTDKAIAVYEELLKQNPGNRSVRERLNELLRAAEQEFVAEADAVAAGDEGPGISEDDVMPVAVDQAIPAAAEPSVQSPLAVLERWLAFLQQRREHVH